MAVLVHGRHCRFNSQLEQNMSLLRAVANHSCVFKGFSSCVCIVNFDRPTSHEELALSTAVVLYSAVHCVSCVPTQVEHLGRGWLHVDEQIGVAEERRDGMNTGRAVRPGRGQVGNAAFETVFPEGSEIRHSGSELRPRSRRIHLSHPFGGAGLGAAGGGGMGTGILMPGASGMSGTSVTPVTKCRVSPKQEVGSPTFSS
jgi:hypothetical protein